MGTSAIASRFKKFGIATGCVYSTALDDQPFCVMNFYHLVDVADQEAELEAHREYLDGKDIRGRIYISHQGINAQLSGPADIAAAYGEWIKTERPAFAGLAYATFPSPGHAFPKLYVRNKALVSLLRDNETLPVTQPEARAEKVSPKRWKQMLQRANSKTKASTGDSANGDLPPVVIDVRNGYEWDIGHFEGAKRPGEYNFVDTPTGEQTYEGLEDIPPETPVMMYCTGGIRCDIYSTVMRKQGFKNLYTLEGGIQNYLRQEGTGTGNSDGDGGGEAAHWKGSLYVFDSRMAVPPHLDSTREDSKLVAMTPCVICGNPAEAPHVNCANVDCNKLFLACEQCKATHKGCCCKECTSAPRMLRPIKREGYYAKLHTYLNNAGDANSNAGDDNPAALRAGEE